MKCQALTTLHHAVTHIRLQDANRSKLAALDALAVEYMQLCQQYAEHFCAIEKPDKFAPPLFESKLSKRWQRVAIQQAAGIVQSWLSNRARQKADYQSRRARYEAHLLEFPNSARKPPIWNEPHLPTLHKVCIQANANVVETLAAPNDDVVKLETATGTQFDFWLQVATLTPRRSLFLPVKLADYHRKVLTGCKLNNSVTLNRRKDGSWWLTLTFDEKVERKPTNAVVGVDVGIANFLTSSTGQRYGSFHGKLARRHKLNRAKRQRKAKLRACLQKHGVKSLPSARSAESERLSRHVRQSINRAVKCFIADHLDCTLALEDLSVSSMRFKARAMNAYLNASQLGHIPDHIQWVAAQHGLPVVFVNPAYSSQACSRCHFVSRENRPSQQTFCCQACGFTTHADANASHNLAARANDEQLKLCRSVDEVKVLLLKRHQQWRDGCP